MKWVKASEQLPSTLGTYFCKYIDTGKYTICRFYINKQTSLIHRHRENIIWLDETNGEKK